jgi:hypothetical protein
LTTIGVGLGGLVVTRIALIVIAAAVGAKVASSPTSIPLMLAITLATQMLVVRARARELGVVAGWSSRRLPRSARRS